MIDQQELDRMSYQEKKDLYEEEIRNVDKLMKFIDIKNELSEDFLNTVLNSILKVHDCLSLCNGLEKSMKDIQQQIEEIKRVNATLVRSYLFVSDKITRVDNKTDLINRQLTNK